MKIYVGEKKKKSVDVAVLIYCARLALAALAPSLPYSIDERRNFPPLLTHTPTRQSDADSRSLHAVAHMLEKHPQQIFHTAKEIFLICLCA